MVSPLMAKDFTSTGKLLIEWNVFVGKDWANEGVSESLDGALLKAEDAVARSKMGRNEWSLRDCLKRIRLGVFRELQSGNFMRRELGFAETSGAMSL